MPCSAPAAGVQGLLPGHFPPTGLGSWEPHLFVHSSLWTGPASSIHTSELHLPSLPFGVLSVQARRKPFLPGPQFIFCDLGGYGQRDSGIMSCYDRILPAQGCHPTLPHT